MIRRVNRGKSHSYIDDDTGEQVPGVTTILKALPKDALINWAATTTAEFAINHWDRLSKLPPATRLKELQGSRYAEKDTAANRGTAVHALAERLVHGDEVSVPDDIAGHVQSYVSFLDEFDVQPILVERTIYNSEHRYCGTLDLVADLIDPDDWGQRTTGIIDLKTSRSGIWGETALQLAAYRHADMWIDEDAGTTHDMPEVNQAFGVHVRADGYTLHPIEAEAIQYRQFLYLMQVALGFLPQSKDLVGPAVEPPTASSYRLVSADD